MVRYLADESLNQHIVAACLRREPALNFLTAAEVGLKGQPDPAVLALAAEQNRILETHDLRTMPKHFGDFHGAQLDSPGVFLVSQHTPVASVAEWLILIWAASDAKEWENRILEVPL